MKRYRNFLTIIISLLLITFTGCEEKILDKTSREDFSENDVWGDFELVKMYVWNNYNALGNWYIFDENRGLDGSMADDSYLIFNKDTWVVLKGQVSADDPGNINWYSQFYPGSDYWSKHFIYINRVNTFFERIDEVEVTTPENIAAKKRLTGEMKFLLAWNYAQLIKVYGGVPLITSVLDLDDDFSNIQRASYKDCVDFIVSQIDEIIANNMLPVSVPADEFGRITKGAALALKSEVLLYAASELHDPSTEPSGPLYDYNVSTKWQDAADAAKAVMDLGVYSLLQVEGPAEYQDMFLGMNHSGLILARPHHPEFYDHTNFDQVHAPNGYHGFSGNCPTHNFVQDFRMNDGLSVEESPLYDDSPENIYKNREMRFYADIVYNGCEYRGRNVEFYLPGGEDSQDGPESWNTTRTGYTIRKFTNENYDFKASHPKTPYPIFRLAEIYLNYAEAQYHLGHEDIAREYLNKVRNRGHLPDATSEGQALLDDIRIERRIELVWEGHRFFDIRRWMIAEDVMNAQGIGVAWKKVDENGDLAIGGELTYEIIPVVEYSFPKRMYYMPIDRGEIESSGLEQNWGY